MLVPVVIKISCFTNYQIQRYMVEDNKIVMKFDCYSSRTKIIMKNFRTKIFFQVYDSPGSLAVARKSDFHWLDLTIAIVFITMNCFVL